MIEIRGGNCFNCVQLSKQRVYLKGKRAVFNGHTTIVNNACNNANNYNNSDGLDMALALALLRSIYLRRYTRNGNNT